MIPFTLSPETLLQELRAFVTAEFQVQRSKHDEQRAKPRHERVEDGTCMEGLRFVRIDEAGRAEFSHKGNDSRLREGDLVTLRQCEEDTGGLAALYREEKGQLWLVTLECCDV